jgi:hypothetical protein
MKARVDRKQLFKIFDNYKTIAVYVNEFGYVPVKKKAFKRVITHDYTSCESRDALRFKIKDNRGDRRGRLFITRVETELKDLKINQNFL